MNKETLDKAVEACKAEAREALQTIYDELNNGQQNKLIKDKTIKEIFERYGVNL